MPHTRYAIANLAGVGISVFNIISAKLITNTSSWQSTTPVFVIKSTDYKLVKKLTHLYKNIKDMATPVLTQLPKLTLFNNDIELEYDKRKAQISGRVNYFNIKHTHNEVELNKIKDLILADLWKWPDLKMDRKNIIPDNDIIQMHPDLAQQTIFPDFSRYEYSVRQINRVTYKITFSGDMRALDFAKKGNGLEFYGAMQGMIVLLYEYTDNEINQEVGKTIQASRDKKLDIIESTLQDNKDFIAERKIEFKSEINKLVDTAYKADVDRNNRNNFL